MKIYVQTDLEGVAGVVNFEDRGDKSTEGYFHRMRMKELLTGEVNACIEGLLEMGIEPENIYINDSHGSGYNILFEKLRPGVKIIHGKLTRQPFWLPLLDESFSAVVGIGGHPMAGTKFGILPHTKWDVNGIALGEMGMCAALAGYFNVPMIFISGDKAVCEELKKIIPDIETAVVKSAFSPYTAVSEVPARACELIKNGVKKSVERRDNIKPFKIKGPYKMTVISREEEIPDKIFEGDDFYNVVKKALEETWLHHPWGIQTTDIQPSPVDEKT
ncbi:M55 family metallopeptidase [Candidatus Calescamantes bacterium]|nr:M55 family metallopeptidase [Candidatus Calescamantes bacterium]